MAADQDRVIRQMIDDLREIVFRTDAEGRWTFLNAAWEEITGFPVAETLGKVFLEYVHPDDRAANLERFRPLIERQKDYCRHEVRYLQSDGGYCWVEVHARAVRDESGALTGTCGTISDINARHAAQEALEHRDAVLEAIGSIAQSFLQGTDWEAAIPSALERWGPSARADRIAVLQRVVAPDLRLLVVPRHVWTRAGAGIPVLDQPFAASEAWERALDSGGAVTGAAASFPPAERAMLEASGIRQIAIIPISVGGVIWGSLSLARSADTEWAPATIEGLRVAAGIVGAAIRQSESQETLRLAHAELERRVDERTADLRRSEERFHGIFDEAPIGMVLTDDEGRIQLANATFQRTLEYSAADLAGKSMLEFTHPEDMGASEQLVRNLKSQPRGVSQIEKRYIAKSGGEVWARTTVADLCFDQGGEHFFIAMVEDVTSRKKLEEEFLHAQRMEAVGRLTGGIAHDFNNILTVIKGYGELLVKAVAADPKASRKAAQIVKATERASNLVNQLLAFSRKRAVETKVMDVNAAIRDVQGMVRKLLREDVVLDMQLDPRTGSVKMDPGQFGQLLMNLAVNARDAIRAAGRVTVSTRRVGVDPRETQMLPEGGTGSYALLEVSDTGCGMPPEVRSRIFEPFFTTKDVGKGTGLGLSTVYGIVQQAGGHIGVESAPGAGTTFRIHLPIAVEAGSESEPVSMCASSVGGSETILLAEDEDEVRSMMAEALRERGYTVIEARNGVEALEIAEKHQGRLDLLVTDMVMPQMGGSELLDNLWARFPAMRFLFTSGHSGTDLDAGPALLCKPFSSADLAARVREVLDAPRPALIAGPVLQAVT